MRRSCEVCTPYTIAQRTYPGIILTFLSPPMSCRPESLGERIRHRLWRRVRRWTRGLSCRVPWHPEARYAFVLHCSPRDQWTDSEPGCPLILVSSSGLEAQKLALAPQGVVWNALNIDYPGHSFSHLGIYYGENVARNNSNALD